MTANGLESRGRTLYEEGARLLAARWDEDVALVRQDTPLGVRHDARASLAYADVLLRQGATANDARIERIIDAVASMQELREEDAHYGNFRWFFEDECVTDLNGVEFALDGLCGLLIEHARKLSPRTADSIRSMIALGLQEIDRLDVHPSYTNIVLSDICNSVLGGQLIADDDFVERGARRLDEWFAFTNASGAPHEYNSPTYAAVDIARLAHLAEHAKSRAIALKARVAEERLWLHVATHYHPELGQLAGPHSRSYRDGWTGAGGYLKLQLWRLLGDDKLRRETPYWGAPVARGIVGREEGHTGVALTPFHCTHEALTKLRQKRYAYETVETPDAAAALDITTYMTESYALGTASRSYEVGDPPEPWPQPNTLLLDFRRGSAPGYGTLLCRYVIDDRDAAAGELLDEGQHVAAQHRNRAIVAYGLRPRMRPLQSCKLAVFMLGVSRDTEIWCGDRRVDTFPLHVDPGEPVMADTGDVYIAVIPLEPSEMGSSATIELNAAPGFPSADAHMALSLSMYNYRGPAKQFWEHRSQGGPFYRGNVRNAFIIEVCERAEFSDFVSFRRHIGAARVTDSVDDAYTREIAYASDGGAIAMRYSLWDMRLAERRFDGVPYAAPMGRAGCVDGSGAQWLQSRDSMIELAGARLMAGRAPKWFFADVENGHYAFVNPSDERVPVWLETPGGTIIEVDEIAFGRIVLDEREAVINVETTEPMGPLRVRTARAPRVIVSGIDVSASLAGPDNAGVRTLETAR